MALKRVEINVGQNGADPTLRKLAEVAAAAKDLARQSPDVSVGASTSVALSKVEALRKEIDALGAKATDMRVGLDDKGLIAKVAGIQAGLAKLDKTTARPNIDLAGLAAADAKLAALDVSLDKVAEKEAAVTGLSGISWLKNGAQGWGTHVNLFGGLLPGILGSVGVVHLLIDSIIEVGAELIPASIAFGAFGLAGYAAAKGIYTEFTNANTAIDAVGGKIPALSGNFAAVQNAVKPQVLTLWGMALEAANSRTGTFGTLATGAGNAVEQFGMRALEAWKSAGASSFAGKAVSDLQTILHIAGNLGGVLGNVLKGVPGTAQVLFHALDDITGALEHITASGAVQGLLKIALGFHGVVLWGGLAATGLAKLWPLIQKVGLSLASGAIGLLRWGQGIAAAATDGQGFATTLDAIIPASLGAAGAAIAVVGVLVGIGYAISRLTNHTQSWITQMNNSVTSQSTLQGALGATSRAMTTVADHSQTLSGFWARWSQAGINSASSNLVRFSATLQSQFHMSTGAISNLVLGMTGSKKAAAQFYTAIEKGTTPVSAAVDQIKAYELATIGMMPTTERARAALYAMQTAGSATAAAIQKVTSAEDQLMGISTGLETAQLNISGNLRTLAQDAQKAGASFTGTNQASTALQLDFESNFLPDIQQVKDGLLNAGASSRQMAQVLSTDLIPAVNLGALKNKAFRDQIYDMAKEAGYRGVDSIRALTGWIDRNKTSAQQAGAAVRTLAGNYGKIPHTYNSIIKISADGSYHMIGANGVAPISDKGVAGGLSHGGLIRHGTTGTADDVLARVSKGELIVPAHMVSAGLVDHLRGHLPGFSAGGYVAGDYRGVSPSFPVTAWNKVLHADESALAKSFSSSIGSMLGGAVGGNVAGWIRTALRLTHAPMAWLGILERLVSLESGGNPRAVDPISVGGQHASGLFQTLGSTFAAYGLGGSMFNPIADAIAGIRYIMSRYGTPFAIPGLLSGAYHGYANGGWINEPVFGMGLRSGDAYSFAERAPEYVGRGQNATNVYVTVNASGLVNPATMGKEIAQAINTYARHNGGTTGMVGTVNPSGHVVKR
jgi:hypothetical protein